jgi:hypothetical protein
MVCFALERAIIRPQVDTVGNTSDASLVNLPISLLSSHVVLGGDLPFQRPRSQQLRIPNRRISSNIQRTRETRTAIQSALCAFHAANKRFPAIEVIWVVFLRALAYVRHTLWAGGPVPLGGSVSRSRLLRAQSSSRPWLDGDV